METNEEVLETNEEVTAPTDKDNTIVDEPKEGSWLPESLADHKVLKEYSSPEDLAKAHLDLHATKRELEKKTSVPESPEAYQLDLKGEDEKEAQAFRSLAHELGMTQKQAQGLLDRMAAINTEMSEAQEKQLTDAREAAVNSLKTDWQDDYDAKLEKAKALVRNHGDEALVNWLDETNLGDVVPFIRFCQKISTLISEDSLEEGGHQADIDRTEDGRLMIKYPTMEAKK